MPSKEEDSAFEGLAAVRLGPSVFSLSIVTLGIVVLRMVIGLYLDLGRFTWDLVDFLSVTTSLITYVNNNKPMTLPLWAVPIQLFFYVGLQVSQNCSEIWVARVPASIALSAKIYGPMGGFLSFAASWPIFVWDVYTRPVCAMDPLKLRQGLVLDAFWTVIIPLHVYYYENDMWAYITKLESAKREAIEDSLLKTQFLRKVCHELRTPFNGILGYLELLAEMTEQKLSTSVIKEYLESAIFCSRRFSSLMNDILKIEKLKQEKIIPTERFPIRNLFPTVISFTNGIISKKQLEFEILIKKDCPRDIQANQGSMEQILINLISNSTKHTKQGHITLLIELVKAKTLNLPPNVKQTADEYIALRVTDTGIGIDSNNFGKIFHPFAQIVRDDKGSGLGLSIVKHSAEAMNGFVEVESEGMGKGCTFSVYLPHLALDSSVYLTNSSTTVVSSQKATYWEKVDKEVRQMDEVAMQINNNNRKMEIEKMSFPLDKNWGKSFDPKSKLILVAEDNLLNQRVIQLMLEKRGYQVHIANNGKEAIDFFKSNVYLCAFVDLEMPIQGGLETTIQMRTASALFPIYVLTAHSTYEDRKLSLEAGANRFLTKPLSSNLLDQVLADLFDYLEQLHQ